MISWFQVSSPRSSVGSWEQNPKNSAANRLDARLRGQDEKKALESSNDLKLFAKTDNNLYAKIRHKAIETRYYMLFVALYPQFVVYAD